VKCIQKTIVRVEKTNPMNESNERKSEKSTAVGRDEGRGNRRNAFIYKAQAPHSKNNDRDQKPKLRWGFRSGGYTKKYNSISKPSFV